MMVAKLGSASAAATQLGLHRATITRHIETVEAALGTTLFLRHARGLKMTDAGKNGKLSGELKVTSLGGVVNFIMPAIKAYKELYPDISVSYLSETQLMQLEYGDAHVAVRAGPKPTVPEYIVLPYRKIRFGLYGHREYVTKIRRSKKNADLADFEYIGSNPEIAIRVNDFQCSVPAVMAKLGVGTLAEVVARDFKDLVAVVPPTDETSIPLWIVTHRDLKKVSKVQEFIRILRETAFD
jgi:DNA-binding transcriptional LysR family regulator